MGKKKLPKEIKKIQAAMYERFDHVSNLIVPEEVENIINLLFIPVIADIILGFFPRVFVGKKNHSQKLYVIGSMVMQSNYEYLHVCLPHGEMHAYDECPICDFDVCGIISIPIVLPFKVDITNNGIYRASEIIPLSFENKYINVKYCVDINSSYLIKKLDVEIYLCDKNGNSNYPHFYYIDGIVYLDSNYKDVFLCYF